MTRWPTRYPVTAAPSSSMTPTGSWPTVSPRATGYSPLRMCTSVPQIVVRVMRRSASFGPIEGTGFSSSTIRPFSTNTAAFMVPRVVRGPGIMAAFEDTPVSGTFSSFPDHQDAARRVRHDVRGHAPDQEFLDSRPPMRAHDDQVDRPGPRRIQERDARIRHDHARLRGQTYLSEQVGASLRDFQVILLLLLQQPPDRVRCAGLAGPHEDGRHRREDQEARPLRPLALRDVVEHDVGTGRIVQPHEHFHGPPPRGEEYPRSGRDPRYP